MSRILADWVLIVAAHGEAPETARALLAHAQEPAHVRAQGTSEFLVPPYLSDAYFAALRPKPRRRKKEEEELTHGN